MLKFTKKSKLRQNIDGNVFDHRSQIVSRKNLLRCISFIKNVQVCFDDEVLYILTHLSDADSLLQRIELILLWWFGERSLRTPNVEQFDTLSKLANDAINVIEALPLFEQRVPLCRLALLLACNGERLPVDVLKKILQQSTELTRLTRIVWPVILELPSTLFRADYEDRRDQHVQRGIFAKDPDNNIDTVEDHIRDGDRNTKFISFTTAFSVAVMYWAQDKSAHDKNRVLLTVDIKHPDFLVWNVSVRDMLPKGESQGRATRDREVIIEPADRALSNRVICKTTDCLRCYNDDESFRTFVNATPRKAHCGTFAAHFLDLRIAWDLYCQPAMFSAPSSSTSSTSSSSTSSKSS